MSCHKGSATRRKGREFAQQCGIADPGIVHVVPPPRSSAGCSEHYAGQAGGARLVIFFAVSRNRIVSSHSINRLFNPLLAAFCFGLLADPSGVMAQNGTIIRSAVVMMGDEEVERLEKMQPDIPAILNSVEVKRIAYLSDDLTVTGYLAAPKTGTKLPCLIYNRGGNRSFGAWNDFGAVTILGRIAARGYVVAASQYRGNVGGEGKEEFGGSDLHDVLDLIPLLSSIPQADPSRIGIEGWSRGGMMTYLALANSDRFAAAAIVSGLADLSDTARRRPDMEKVFTELIPDYASNKEEALAARSAVRWPEKLYKKTPILLIHGSSDWRVHPSEALAMASKLYESQHRFRFVFLEGGDHSLVEHHREVNRLVDEWFDGYVRDRNAWPSLAPHGR